ADRAALRVPRPPAVEPEGAGADDPGDDAGGVRAVEEEAGGVPGVERGVEPGVVGEVVRPAGRGDPAEDVSSDRRGGKRERPWPLTLPAPKETRDDLPFRTDEARPTT